MLATCINRNYRVLLGMDHMDHAGHEIPFEKWRKQTNNRGGDWNARRGGKGSGNIENYDGKRGIVRDLKL